MTAIATQALTKHYGGGRRGPTVRALDDLTVEVREGEIFGFLGPNGAGKSTTIRLLLGFLHATAGSASILGLDTARDSVAIRRRVGYLPGGIALYDGLTGQALLDHLAALGGWATPRRAELCDRLELSQRTLGRLDPRLLARDAPEDRHRPGAPARAGAGDPRRAQRGPRPADAARVLRDPRGPACGGSDDLPVVARPLRGGAHLRPRGHRACRPARRARGRREPPGPPQAPRGDPAGRPGARSVAGAGRERARSRRMAGSSCHWTARSARSWPRSRVPRSST